MTNHETWRTRQYWQSVGGLLIEEFMAVRPGKNHSRRVLDGVIVLGEPEGIHPKNFFDIKGREVICIQTKRVRIGMLLLGQAYFSKFLLEQYQPKSIKSVAICGRHDAVMMQLAAAHNVEVVVIEDKENTESTLD